MQFLATEIFIRQNLDQLIFRTSNIWSELSVIFNFLFFFLQKKLLFFIQQKNISIIIISWTIER